MSPDPPEERTPITRPDEKTRLECEKLQAEIESIRRPFYRIPTFYIAATPVALAIIGVIFTWGSGWFDVQHTRINNEKLLVEAETERLQQAKTNLELETEHQREHVNAVENDLANMRAEKSSLTNQLAGLLHERDEFDSMRNHLEFEIKRLAGSNSNAIEAFAELKAAQAERRSLTSELDSVKATNQMLARSDKENNAVLQRVAVNLLEGMRLGTAEKVRDARWNAYYHDLIILSTEIYSRLPEWQRDGVLSNELKPYSSYGIRPANDPAPKK